MAAWRQVRKRSSFHHYVMLNRRLNFMRRLDYSKVIILMGLIGAILFIVGCADSGSEPSDEYLIRVGDTIMTVVDFNRAFELAKTAYPHNALKDPIILKTLKFRLLSQLTEEVMLLERAKEMNITVSEAEVEEAIADIKKDYPEGVFEETLLEQAISYSAWKEGMKIRLLKEKVITKELEEHVTITAGDISNYIENQNKPDDSESGLETELKEGTEDINAMIIKHLRRKKSEEAYHAWIKKLQEKYIIEINKEKWKKITNS
jgi:hypothetical protein